MPFHVCDSVIMCAWVSVFGYQQFYIEFILHELALNT
jgi:hypothetical protein